MSEPMDKREEVKLPFEAGVQKEDWDKAREDYKDCAADSWEIQARAENNFLERQLKSSLAANRQMKRDLDAVAGHIGQMNHLVGRVEKAEAANREQKAEIERLKAGIESIADAFVANDQTEIELRALLARRGEVYETK